MKLADVVDSKSTGETRAGSSPATSTKDTLKSVFFIFIENSSLKEKIDRKMKKLYNRNYHQEEYSYAKSRNTISVR